MLQSVKELRPGHYLLFEDRQGTEIKWWDVPYSADEMDVSQKELISLTRERVKDAASCQLVGGVPVGAFLSGGLDSSSIVAMMRAIDPQGHIRSYTAGFVPREDSGEGFPDDIFYARKVAQ